MSIKLKDIFKIEDEKQKQYKVHLATWNGSNHPLDKFVVSGEKEVRNWNNWVNGERNKLNRKYVFTLLNFYHEKHIWLFAGIYEVRGNPVRHTKPIPHLIYDTKLTEQFKSFVGRLKIHFHRRGKFTYPNLETHINRFTVAEILKEQYTGEEFPGYENISINFSSLQNIIGRNKPDWKAALENVKGVYLITDGNNGKKYVGAAYGEQGIWARWSCYAKTGGRGYTDGLTKLIKKKGEKYALENFTFSLLEYRPMKTDDQDVIDRETFWKKALLSREFGYNSN